jgi:hypothetical protein
MVTSETERRYTEQCWVVVSGLDRVERQLGALAAIVAVALLLGREERDRRGSASRRSQ